MLEVPTIESDRVVLRKVEPTDAADIYAYAKVPEVSKFLPWTPHQSIEDSKRFISGVLYSTDIQPGSSRLTWVLVLKSSSHVVGTFDFQNWGEHKRVDVGYALGRPYWNQGIMTEVLTRMIKCGFEEMDLNRIQSTCDDLNIGSWRVMEKSGMKQEALMKLHMVVKGRVRDTRLYAILKHEWLAESS